MIGDIPKNWRQAHVAKDFVLGEFFVSRSFPKLALGMNPRKDYIDAAVLLSAFCLQPVRDKFGPVHITSGFRSVELNNAVGGVVTSQHVRGKAVDFYCPGKPNMHEVYLWILEKLDWPGELFYYSKRGHVHVGLPEYGVHADRKVLEV